MVVGISLERQKKREQQQKRERQQKGSNSKKEAKAKKGAIAEKGRINKIIVFIQKQSYLFSLVLYVSIKCYFLCFIRIFYFYNQSVFAVKFDTLFFACLINKNLIYKDIIIGLDFSLYYFNFILMQDRLIHIFDSDLVWRIKLIIFFRLKIRFVFELCKDILFLYAY